MRFLPSAAPSRSASRRKLLRRGVTVTAVALVALLGLSGPAYAGYSSVSHAGGADIQVSFTFSGTRTVTLSTVHVRDTKCNANPAWGGVQAYYDGGSRVVDFWNFNGCNTTKTWTNQTITTPTTLINIRVGADGDGRPGGLATSWGSYLDNPGT